ncbi:hypothetical protein [Erwinia sp. JUb26]|uniref:hypothetical protein n=1 Tax=Erwinia sp. JUb26 TaxID=2485126 RepID=UPI000F988742|nr:hypothetical protein [Erwinia sp. JUb26]ROR14943.1 hypothetical protein EC836_101443 [Erwinia sp. JUb26]
MKVTTIEMRGLLTGKCVPRDMKVNEDLAQYFVRKFEDHAAEVARLNEQVRALAAENADLKESRSVLAENSLETCNAIFSAGYHNADIQRGLMQSTGNGNKYPNPIKTLVDEALRPLETPATDAILNEVRAQAIEGFMAWSDSHIEEGDEHEGALREVSKACKAYAARIRKGYLP